MKYLLLLILMIISFNLKSQNVIVKITRSSYSDIISDVEKWSKDYKKDFKINYCCRGERIFIFEIISDKYKDPNDLIVELELQFLEAEFFIKNIEDLEESKCRDELIKY